MMGGVITVNVDGTCMDTPSSLKVATLIAGYFLQCLVAWDFWQHNQVCPQSVPLACLLLYINPRQPGYNDYLILISNGQRCTVNAHA